MTQINSGLQLIVLNTNMYYTLDKLTAGEEDPGGQLQWLEGTLAMTRQTKQKVNVKLHVKCDVKINSAKWPQNDCLMLEQIKEWFTSYFILSPLCRQSWFILMWFKITFLGVRSGAHTTRRIPRPLEVDVSGHQRQTYWHYEEVPWTWSWQESLATSTLTTSE